MIGLQASLQRQTIAYAPVTIGVRLFLPKKIKNTLSNCHGLVQNINFTKFSASK